MSMTTVLCIWVAAGATLVLACIPFFVRSDEYKEGRHVLEAAPVWVLFVSFLIICLFAPILAPPKLLSELVGGGRDDER